MSYTAVNKDDASTFETPTLTRVRSENKKGGVAVRAEKKTPNSVTTSIYLDEEATKTAGLRVGQRVSVLRGTGSDAGKIRIIANPKGALKIAEAYNRPEYKLKIRSNRVFDRKISMRDARITSYAKGAITVQV